ncbi:hypothetical protein FOXG_11303 [Fusarium oxysporum f. sp. lycopersici 4287]|uniref:Glycosyl transferase CAP10 domain-containing protein n=1 Tax=Fusarium oxysporum f. sp. lycopersici (strain 4287 / CBS 123668 / FGSC 9935 / NRRL 34936) TaxID=426428 RepID=A0A0J9VJJ7_FUSO4|nr:hypothetical protein FOXG_11303 [Fusarium oxysporum f. sp. lycopersici 4287]XP_018249444.1 hypothetical protein FOXG_11303 [Fusarium oxysporum f. sp. lycopersici 4287]KNB11398.1 hypothetical protein FOXG_11303 [Fusarium oxysporum f. sp. lycopersici 4287]KNB11399.1 hypothetical protein FOXG_11303 [Fusarium oxysporum f. sp. lycopersici 4287]
MVFNLSSSSEDSFSWLSSLALLWALLCSLPSRIRRLSSVILSMTSFTEPISGKTVGCRKRAQVGVFLSLTRSIRNDMKDGILPRHFQIGMTWPKILLSLINLIRSTKIWPHSEPSHPTNFDNELPYCLRCMAFHTIGIKDGNASRLPEVTGHDAEVLDGLVVTINKFAKFLPDMLFPVNLGVTPRILPSWETANGHSRADLTPIVNLISKRAVKEDDADQVKEAGSAETPVPAPLPALPDYPQDKEPSMISPANYRQMQVEACPPGSRTRTNPHWNIGEFCAECVRRHSKAQLMVNWERSLQYCFQPDLKYLHGMSLSSPHAEPIRDLLPLFGFSKSEPFNDILIPLPQEDDDRADIGWNFDRRYDAMFWRGQTDNGVISDQALRGNHKFRLLHMLGNQNPEDKVSIVLPTAKDASVYRHEKVPITEANLVLPSSVGMNNYTGCIGPNCELLHQTYPIVNEAQDQEPLEYRYILLLDTDHGPSPDLLRVLRSKSVPFISTIFRTWYSDRLIPWLHFVPIDTRYQGLHTTLTYFTGTQKKAYLNGRDTDMKGLAKDGAWIAQQGAKWANQALGEKDKEVYLFRLLLEWGRLVDDKRDEIGTSKNDKGELKSSPWTKNQKW